MNWTDELNYFLDCFMLSGLRNFVVDCSIQSTSSSSVSANNVPKKQSNIRIRTKVLQKKLSCYFI